MTVWVDYSSGRPGGAALRAAGITGVIRYAGVGSAGKRITAAEYRDLVAHGIEVLLVCELGTTDVLGGYNAGVSNAKATLADARGMGIPDSVGIAAAADAHLTPAQVATGLGYVQGFRDVLGVGRTGAYGFSEFVDAVHAQAGLASWFWKCGSAPTTAERAWVHFWQRNAGQTTQVINGTTCDLNDQINPLPGGDDMVPADLLNTPLPVPVLDANGNYQGDLKDANGQVVTSLFGDYVRFADIYIQAAFKQNLALSATVTAQTAAISALSQNASVPVTADQINTMIQNAVAQHVNITGTVTVSGVPTSTIPAS